MAADLDFADRDDPAAAPATLLARLVDPSTETGAAYHSAPAAKYYHQAYRHGLIEHCLSVAQGVSALAAGPFRGGSTASWRSPARCCDIGKTQVYASVNGAIEFTDSGKLLGEIPLGYYMVRREIERIDGFLPRRPRACCTSS